jgi:hypothetical protein
MRAVPLFLLSVHYSREMELAALGSGICAVFSKHDDLDALVRRARQELKLEPPAIGEAGAPGET